MRKTIITFATLGALMAASVPVSTAYAATTPTVSSQITAQITNDLQAQDTKFSVALGLTQTESVLNNILSQQTYMDTMINNIYYSSNGVSTTVNIQWRQTKQQSTTLDAKIDQVLQKIIPSSTTSPYMKEFLIHNWLVDHITYDTTETRYTAYDAMQGSAVCEGIAALTYRMLQLAGIPNQLVSGTSNGGSHMWNIVDIASAWYQLDVTWDDPVNKTPGSISYDYFNLTDAQMEHDHVWNHTGLPACITDFANVVKTELKRPNNQDFVEIATDTGILAGINSPPATSQNLHQVVQTQINEKKATFTIKFQGSMSAANSVLNSLFSQQGLYGFSNIQYSSLPSRDSGYTMLTFDVTYF